MQRFEDNTPSNTLKSRALGAIALSPTGNAQGDFYFMLPATGKKLSRHSWTVLPMTDTVIARVEAIALYQRQPFLQASGLVVEWQPDQPIADDENDFDYALPLKRTLTFLSPQAATTTTSTTTTLLTFLMTTHILLMTRTRPQEQYRIRMTTAC